MNKISKALVLSVLTLTTAFVAWKAMPYAVNMEKWNVPENEKDEAYQLAQNLIRYGSYTWDCSKGRPHPPGSRKRPYQSLDEMHGSRNMEHRYQVMQLPENMKGKRILDLGCNLGRICLDTAAKGAEKVVGVDFNPDMIRMATEYKEWKEKHGEDLSMVEYHVADLNKGVENLKSIIGNEKYDYVFALAVWGVVDHESLWNVINHYATDTVWFEGHNIDGKYGDQSKEHITKELRTKLNSRGVHFLGFTQDDKSRNRANFRVSMKPQEATLLTQTAYQE